jgi:psiF repeat
LRRFAAGLDRATLAAYGARRRESTKTMEQTMRKILIASAAALFATCSMALAQTTTTEKPKKPTKPLSEASIACSKQADDQGLTGKERKAFRKKCKQTWKKPA